MSDTKPVHFGQLACGAAGRWNVNVDEAADGAWFLDFDAPHVFVTFKLVSPAAVAEASRFLRSGLPDAGQKNGAAGAREAELHLGSFDASTVSLLWDTEASPRCILLIASSPAALRLTLDETDIADIAATLDEVIAELPQVPAAAANSHP